MKMHSITIFIMRNPVIMLISFVVHPLSAIIFLCKGTVPEWCSSTALLLNQNWDGSLRPCSSDTILRVFYDNSTSIARVQVNIRSTTFCLVFVY